MKRNKKQDRDFYSAMAAGLARLKDSLVSSMTFGPEEEYDRVSCNWQRSVQARVECGVKLSIDIAKSVLENKNRKQNETRKYLFFYIIAFFGETTFTGYFGIVLLLNDSTFNPLHAPRLFFLFTFFLK